MDVTSERLDLVWLGATCLQAIVDRRWADAGAAAGFEVTEEWGEATVHIAAYRLRQVAEHPDDAEWLLHAIVRRSDGVAIGFINFHSAPTDGVAELGYRIIERHRRQGYATEAVAAAMGWARQVHGVHRFRLSIGPTNQASLAMADQLHFTHVGEQIDEVDGLELVFERVL